MAEKAKKTNGVVIRVSQDVYRELCARRRTRGPKTRLWESWDSLLRRTLGLPSKKGEHFQCLEGFIVGNRFFPNLREARGAAVLERARLELERSPKPIPVREVV